MTTKRNTTELIQGHATHRRTENDYMGSLLDTVTWWTGAASWLRVLQQSIQGE